MKKRILGATVLVLMGVQAQAEEATQAPQTAPVAQVTPTTTEINCDYKIPAETKKVESSMVMAWTEKAVVQTFAFNPDSIDAQLLKLKSCFTPQGWDGFNSALQKSGNIESIKSQKLQVSSQIDGQPTLSETKDNQWEVIVPLKVVYQNDKEKVSQNLQVSLSVSRKISGDLGIDKIIATTKSNEGQPAPEKVQPINAN